MPCAVKKRFISIINHRTIFYCRTRHDKDAKIMLKTLYQDIKATSNARYFMAKINEKENKKDDVRDFITEAFEIKTSSINLINRDELNKCLADLKQEEL